MTEHISHTTTKIPNEKNFGIVFGFVFLLIGAVQFYYESVYSLYWFITSVLFFFIAFTIPQIFKIPNKLWFKFGVLLGYIISPIIMAIIFLFVITPFALVLRLLRKDLLNQEIEKNKTSYWDKRKNDMQSLRKQF